MVDREKVIKALRACYPADVKWCQARVKGQCDYNVAYCRMALFKDAAELLEAQEPRVMTLEDLWVLKFNDAIILEQKIPSLLIPAIVRDNIKHDDALEVLQVVTASTNGTANADYEYYGKTWRCWTSRPTDAQRKEIPWE